MNKKLFIGLVVLLSLALLGIITMQYFWFRNSIRVKQAELNLSVNDAMRNSALKLENRETLQKLLASLNKNDSLSNATAVVTQAPVRRGKPAPENPDARRRRENGPGEPPSQSSDLMAHNTEPISSSEKLTNYSGVNYKYSINIDSVLFAEEMRDQMYRYNEHLRHEREDEAARKKLEATNDSIMRRNREHAGEPAGKPLVPARAKIIIDGKEIHEPSFSDVLTLRKVIGEYYRSRPNDPSKIPPRPVTFEAFRAELKRYQGHLSDSVMKFKMDSFIRKTYNTATHHLTRAEIDEFERRATQKSRNMIPMFRFPFFDPSRFRPGGRFTLQDTLVQKRIKHLTGIIDQIILEVNTDHSLFNKRLNTKLIDSVLTNELKNNGVTLKPEYAVYNDLTGKQSPIYSAGYIATEEPDYSTRLFPDDLFGSPYSLKLQFKDKDAYVLESMSLMLSMSVLLTGFLILAFIFAFWAILKQKKISEIRSDFINNITHEFKTPISTIGLAIDSIDNPRIIENKQQIQYFTRIIREENYRMNQLVENVLRAALLDRKNLKQNIDEVDLHELIHRAVNHSQLQIETRRGQITLDLQAEQSVIEADTTQVLNAILNLIDNAIKYSRENPQITISTRQQGNRIVCAIEDKGIGISNEVQRKIFDRFYRYTDGNIHDVKGHGLGLSFVKAIVDAHNGRISVSSEPGKGSRFEVILPLKPDMHEE